MIRYLLLYHPRFCCIILFIAAMLAIRLVIAPGIVAWFGDAGFVVTMLALFGIGFLIEQSNH
jgi:type IV secretory pathway VirB2 component (pilin)